jgi:signal transduction histidine kinase
LPETKALTGREAEGDISRASLAHEMKTPMAALQASVADLHGQLRSLLEAAARSPDAEILREIFPLITEALREPAPSPPTGLEGQRRMAEVVERLKRAGMADGLEKVAREVVYGGWESRLDRIAPLLASRGEEALLSFLVPAGRIRSNLSHMNLSLRRLDGISREIRATGAGPGAHLLDLRGSIEAAVEILRHATPAGVRIDTRCDGRSEVRAEAVQVEQILTNLVANALEAVPATGGRIGIECRRTGSQVEIRVADNGPGIPPEVQDSLFEPFATTKPEGKGTGLGLFISRRLVEDLGGSLTFSSRPGATVFEVLLPAAGAPAPGGGR